MSYICAAKSLRMTCKQIKLLEAKVVAQLSRQILHYDDQNCKILFSAFHRYSKNRYI